ncbi:hypothetical protein PC112_g22196, partial [Phytophthora cactorum]
RQGRRTSRTVGIADGDCERYDQLIESLRTTEQPKAAEKSATQDQGKRKSGRSGLVGSKKAQSPSWTEGTAQISETGGQFSRNYATERRFQFFLQERVKDNAKTEDANTLREQWTDEPTKEQQEKYQGLHSYWDCQNSAHEERLLKLMKEWILDQTLPQSEIEARLHHFHFENQGEALTETTEETNKPKSYRDALGANMIKEATTEESTEAQRLYQLAAQDTFAGVKALRTLAITGRLPSKNAERKCTYAAAATTWTLNRLQDALTSQRLGSVKTGKTGSPYGTTQTSATTPVGDTSRNMGDSSPSLPGEWEQHRPMRKVSKATKPGDSELMTGTTSLPVVGTRPYPGIPVDDWIKLLGGTITDVAATEECGWLAFYAALRNATEGFSPPTDTIIAAANDLKKQVLNGMIANLADEAKIHKADIDAEKHASGLTKEDISLADAGLCKLANHYAEQRRKSVDALVHKSFWVRAAHLKAMAMHAREQVFVLDVSPNGAARIQMYAYRDLSISPTERI